MAKARHGGFSLIEVLVAFAILALALTTILSLFATGLRNTALAHEYGRALVLAESKMAALQGMDANRLAPETGDGVFDGRYHWRSAVHLQDEAGGVSGVAMYALSVQVQWNESGRMRAIDLSTVRLGRAP